MTRTRVGIVGLGRLGREYAINLHSRIERVELVAACSINPEELEFAKSDLAIPVFSDLDIMLQKVAMDALFVISSTSMHAGQIIKGLQAGLHVFSEKPLAITVEECRKVEEIAKQHPDQIAVVGFVRRFDQSYQYAKRKIDQGAIGRPFLIRSQTVDKDSIADWQIKYVLQSGGIFHDFNVHDIDLARWFLASEIKTVWSIGGAYKYPAFAEAGDADNVISTCRLANGTMAVINAGRTATHGHDTYTEIVGTEGSILIGRPAQKHLVQIYDKHGSRREWVEVFWDRFSDAFLTMTKDFIECIQAGKKPELTLNDATQVTRVAIAFTESFQQGKLIHLD